MIRDKQELKTADGQIHVIFRSEKFELDDDRSLVTVYYDVDDSEEFKDESDPNLLVNILSVDGSIHLGDEHSGFFMNVKFDTRKIGWKINCTRVTRVSGLIFPHEIDINLDNMELLVHFDVYS